ncbi:unnamed protein product [Paramecium sonneborni]|uniref:Uncharacterized protein n=1 Tax=Paramecium sonneborni TaxID=65129 RepID=A0A8S1RIN3_9CILI|nr:unnamed protein product [Paramecium sonneborni]
MINYSINEEQEQDLQLNPNDCIFHVKNGITTDNKQQQTFSNFINPIDASYDESLKQQDKQEEINQQQVQKQKSFEKERDSMRLYVNRFQKNWGTIGLQILQESYQYSIDIDKKSSKDILKRILQDPTKSTHALKVLQNPLFYKEIEQLQNKPLQELMSILIGKFFKHVNQDKKKNYQSFIKLRKVDNHIDQLLRLLQNKIQFNTETRQMKKRSK